MARYLCAAAVLAGMCLGSEQAPLPMAAGGEACPDYASYSKYSHQPLSAGPLALPYQRPDVRCRTFHSDAIEKVIVDVTSRMRDPDLARLFENAFPSTTDTTVKFHTDGAGLGIYNTNANLEIEDGQWAGPQTFVITGDIVAEWLRDSTNQLAPYQALAKKDPAILTMILGAINTQAEYVAQSPYCNAFQPPVISNLAASGNGPDDMVHPAYEPTIVFECKYELDSLAHFLALGNALYRATGSTGFVNARWLYAVENVLAVLEQQSRPTFDSETGRFVRNVYTFQRHTNVGTETLSLQGVGNPLNNGTGLVRSAFRPSDDATIFGYLIPSNAMMAVELERTSEVLKKAGREDLAGQVLKWSQTIRQGVWDHGVVKHAKYGDVFAYEVDGYGSSVLMDDANYPSLLALPLLGFVAADAGTYQNTRRMLLDKGSNPYYLVGQEFHGIGGEGYHLTADYTGWPRDLSALADAGFQGPHVGPVNAWPMSLLIQARTSDDDDEIQSCLELVLKASKLGLVHESVDVNHVGSYTRSWFAWANGVLAETVLDIAKRKPHLIFKSAKPYEI